MAHFSFRAQALFGIGKGLCAASLAPTPMPWTAPPPLPPASSSTSTACAPRASPSGASSGGGGAVDLSFVDSLALAMFLVTLAGIFTVVAFAISNSMATAPVSVVCGLAVIIVAAMCGLSGHPASAWGPDAVLAAGLVAISLFVMGRRAA